MELILPDRAYYTSYLEAIEEYKANNVSSYVFYDDENADIFENFENDRLGINLPEKFVPATTLWLVENGGFIGEISIRHRLNENLKRFGGNIGYGVRFSKWNMGYGTKMLSMALRFAGENFGFQKVLITCNDDNYGSAHVIEKNGGILQDKIINVINGKERITRRYWIEL